jgi:hypothetical protein
MNRLTSYRNRGGLAFVSLLIVASSARSMRADDAIPIEPRDEQPPRIQRLEIVDAPDPIGNGITLRTKSGGSLNAPTYSPNAVPESPEVAVDPASGRAVVGWLERAGDTYDFVAASANSSGWGAPCRVAESGVALSAPAVVFLPDGRLTVVYVVASGTESRAFVRIAAPPEWRFSPPEPVSPAGEVVTHAHATVHEGQLHVVYARRDGPATSIVHATPSASGFDLEVVAVTSFAGATLPQIHSHAGRLWIDWVDAEAPTGAGELAWKRQGAGGAWEPTRYETTTSPFQRDYHARPGIRLQAIAP